MVKGTASKGKRSGKKSHIRCRRCGRHSYHVRHHKCAHCGFPASKFTRRKWVVKPPNQAYRFKLTVGRKRVKG